MFQLVHFTKKCDPLVSETFESKGMKEHIQPPHLGNLGIIWNLNDRLSGRSPRLHRIHLGRTAAKRTFNSTRRGLGHRAGNCPSARSREESLSPQPESFPSWLHSGHQGGPEIENFHVNLNKTDDSWPYDSFGGEPGKVHFCRASLLVFLCSLRTALSS